MYVKRVCLRLEYIEVELVVEQDDQLPELGDDVFFKGCDCWVSSININVDIDTSETITHHFVLDRKEIPF